MQYPKWRVNYSILHTPRTDTFNGTGSSSTDNLYTVVEAFGPSDARTMVEQQNGGWSRCKVYGVEKL